MCSFKLWKWNQQSYFRSSSPHIVQQDVKWIMCFVPLDLRVLLHFAHNLWAKFQGIFLDQCKHLLWRRKSKTFNWSWCENIKIFGLQLFGNFIAIFQWSSEQLSIPAYFTNTLSHPPPHPPSTPSPPPPFFPSPRRFYQFNVNVWLN